MSFLRNLCQNLLIGSRGGFTRIFHLKAMIFINPPRFNLKAIIFINFSHFKYYGRGGFIKLMAGKLNVLAIAPLPCNLVFLKPQINAPKRRWDKHAIASVLRTRDAKGSRAAIGLNFVGAGSPTSLPTNRYARKPAPSPPTNC